MTDLMEMLQELEHAERELAYECDCPPEATANWKYAETCARAADEITRLRAEVTRLSRSNEAKRESRDSLIRVSISRDRENADLRAANAKIHAETLDRAAQLVEQECRDHDESIRLGTLIRGLK